MKQFNPYADPHRYVAYYHNQAGGYINGFAGIPVMYGGFGLGSLLKGLYRMAMPLLRRGIGIAKPHLKAAAKNIVSDVVSNVMQSRSQDSGQEGSGVLVMQRRNMRRPPGVRPLTLSKKYNPKPKKRSVSKRKVKSKQRGGGPAKKKHKYIF